MTFAEFNTEIRTVEGRLAYGSETSILGHFVERMREVHKEVAPNDEWGWRESDAIMPDDEVAWWRKAYELYEVNQILPPDEQASSVQDIFDRV